jgi:hypothetical protein
VVSVCPVGAWFNFSRAALAVVGAPCAATAIGAAGAAGAGFGTLRAVVAVRPLGFDVACLGRSCGASTVTDGSV